MIIIRIIINQIATFSCNLCSVTSGCKDSQSCKRRWSSIKLDFCHLFVLWEKPYILLGKNILCFRAVFNLKRTLLFQYGILRDIRVPKNNFGVAGVCSTHTNSWFGNTLLVLRGWKQSEILWRTIPILCGDWQHGILWQLFKFDW